jgi:hypothetical protein
MKPDTPENWRLVARIQRAAVREKPPCELELPSRNLQPADVTARVEISLDY